MYTETGFRQKEDLEIVKIRLTVFIIGHLVYIITGSIVIKNQSPIQSQKC